MIRKLFLIGLMTLLALSVVFMTGCGPADKPAEDPPTAEGDNTGSADAGDTGGATTEVVAEKQYACPMKQHTEVFTDPDAKCPQCGMAVVEIDDDMDGDMEDHNDKDD